MQLRWEIRRQATSKKWKEWPSPGLKDRMDGGYEYISETSRVLQFLNESGQWEDVPEVWG